MGVATMTSPDAGPLSSSFEISVISLISSPASLTKAEPQNAAGDVPTVDGF